ncbi:MAG: ABC transporter ATP-binding protein [Thermoprotei archaeon]|nr:MAG: ABC transporter ATP-binding protein [Thermoprotei archaeon]
MPNVVVVNVKKRYGEIVALDGVNLEIKDREYVCIIGPSGSGKSTLLKVIAGILEPDEGQVYIDGIPVSEIPIEERRLGIVMQDIMLFPHMNIWDNVIYSPVVKGLQYNIVREKGLTALSLLEIDADLNSLPNELSRGAQQKVALARALAADAKLLLLDEPLGSIDARTARVLRYELRRIVKSLGLTAIHVTHNQEEAMSIADRIVIMRRGKVEQVGTPIELYASPKTPFVCRFIGGEANFFEGTITERNGTLATIKLKNGTKIVAEELRGINGKVVVAIRPEHISITEDKEEMYSDLSSENVLKGRIIEVNFLGSYIRYVVDTDEGEIIVKAPRNAIVLRENTPVLLNINKAYVFNYPEEGLERAIAYE